MVPVPGRPLPCAQSARIFRTWRSWLPQLRLVWRRCAPPCRSTPLKLPLQRPAARLSMPSPVRRMSCCRCWARPPLRAWTRTLPPGAPQGWGARSCLQLRSAVPHIVSPVAASKLPPHTSTTRSTAAARSGHERLLLRLLEAVPPGSLPAAAPGTDSPLIWACFKGLAAAAAALVEAGPGGVHHRGELGNTALHAAAMAGSMDICRLLLYHGASPMARNSYDNTPAAVASTPACRALLTHPEVEALRADMDAAAAAERARLERESAQAAERLRLLQEEEERRRQEAEEAARLAAEAEEAARLAAEEEARRAAEEAAARAAAEAAEAERVAEEEAAAAAAAAARKKKSGKGTVAASTAGKKAAASPLGKPGSGSRAATPAAPGPAAPKPANLARTAVVPSTAASSSSRPASGRQATARPSALGQHSMPGSQIRAPHPPAHPLRRSSCSGASEA